jgi:rhamnosyltransferase
MKFSVLIRTYNSSRTLGLVLSKLQLHQGDELTVVDSGSTDDTLSIAAQQGAKILTLPQEEFTYGRALNIGFAAAASDWVLVLSSHSVPVPDDLLAVYRRAVRRFPDSIAAAVGPILYTELDRRLQAGITFYDNEDFAAGFDFGAGNPNALYRRSLWLHHRFDETLTGVEDLEWYVWALKAGYLIAAVHAAEIRYAARGPAAHFYRKGYRDYQTARRFVARPHKPTTFFLLSHSFKLLFYWLFGRIDRHGFRASFANYLGSWVASMKDRT